MMKIAVEVDTKLVSVSPSDRESFMSMAASHFRELSAGFEPHDDWRKHYFEKIISNPNMDLCWINSREERVGFILFGLEEHRFLPRTTGAIYELYVEPRFRRKGIARKCAQLAIEKLQKSLPSKLQLEIMHGNVGAKKMWSSLGFKKVCERWVLEDSTH